MTSMPRNSVALTSFRRHVPSRFLINQCQIITFLILKSDIIENSGIELREIVLPIPSNQIKVAFIIILPFNLVDLWFFPVSHRNWRKRWVNYWGAKGYIGPPSQIIGGGGGGGGSWSALIFVSARQHMLISDNLSVRKSYFDSNRIHMKMQGYCDIFYLKDYFEADIDRSTYLHAM